MGKISLYTILILALAGVVLSGCTRRDLEMRPDKGYLKINLSWKHSPSPEVTTYYFYDTRGSEAILAEGTNAGYEGWLPVGSYHVVISNREMVGAAYQANGSHEDDIVCADGQVLRTAPDYIDNVDNVFGTGLGEITIPASDTRVTVDGYPRSYVRYITFIVQPEDMDNVSELEIEISGIIYAVKAYSGEPLSAETSAIRTNVAKNAEDGVFRQTVSVFGFAGMNELFAKVTFSGQDDITSFPVNITEELAGLPYEGGTVIVPLQFPDGGKLSVTVNVRPWGWGGSGGGIIE